MGIKTKVTRIAPYCPKLGGSYELRYNEEFKQQMWFCTHYTTQLLGYNIDRTESISDANDRLELPLKTRPVTHTVVNDTVQWQGSSVGQMPKLGWVYPGDTKSNYGYIADSGFYWASQWAYWNWQDLCPLPDAGTLRVKRDAAYRSTLPSFTSNFSLANFLFELKDFNKLFRFTDSKWSLKEHVESNFLNWTFGWVPFANDLVNLHGAYLRVKNVWDHIKANSDDSIVTTTGTADASYSRTDTYPSQKNVWNSNVSYRIQTRYRYDVLDTSTEQRSTIPDGMYAASVAQALGLCANPAIIWNALPFSFVVDWFVPISSALDRMKQDTFVPGHVVLGHDIHTKIRRKLAVSGSAAIPECDPAHVRGYSVEFANRSYERSPNFGAADITAGPLDGLRIGGPTGYQWFVGAILGSHIFL